MLLWILILALFGSAVAAFGGNLPPSLRARVLGVQAWIGIGFIAFTLLTSNPFARIFPAPFDGEDLNRSEEHTSELQSLMRISYAVFCLKKKKYNKHTHLISNHYIATLVICITAFTLCSS